MARTFYAIEHTYGATACDPHGHHIGGIREFTSKRERDEWVDQGNPYFTQSGAREALYRGDKTLEAYLRRKRENPYE